MEYQSDLLARPDWLGGGGPKGADLGRVVERFDVLVRSCGIWGGLA